MIKRGVSMQTKEQIELSYRDGDAWDFETNAEDAKRKRYIIHVLRLFGPFERALDIGCGQGFIARDLPADEIHGFEISDNAASRLPPNVKRMLEPEGKYDLVTACGIMYSHYDWDLFASLIEEHSSNVILLCNISSWELSEGVERIPGKQVFTAFFPYREWSQALRVFKVGG